MVPLINDNKYCQLAIGPPTLLPVFLFKDDVASTVKSLDVMITPSDTQSKHFRAAYRTARNSYIDFSSAHTSHICGLAEIQGHPTFGASATSRYGSESWPSARHIRPHNHGFTASGCRRIVAESMPPPPTRLCSDPFRGRSPIFLPAKASNWVHHPRRHLRNEPPFHYLHSIFRPV